MKVSVIMIDGGFRENTFGSEYFTKQDFPENEYEVIWVEFYQKVPVQVTNNKKVKVIRLNNSPDSTYHSSYCFNQGISEASGELLIIPDADQIVRPDFISKIWQLHLDYSKLVVYVYRYDEISEGALTSFNFDELEKKCILKNPLNFGGCLTVKKNWLTAINGYEQHSILESGFHANGLDIYTRLKNIGLAIMWSPDIKLFHPWHPFTLSPADQYRKQLAFIDWRKQNLQYEALSGIDVGRNFKGFDVESHIKSLSQLPKKKITRSIFSMEQFRKLF